MSGPSAILRHLPLIAVVATGGACLRYPDAGDDSGQPGAADQTHATLAGTIGDATGAPLAGARVTTLPRGYEATTDADGRYEIGLLPPDSYQVVAKAEGYQAATSDPVEVAAAEVGTLDLLLEADAPGGLLSVRLLGPDDQPLAGASVTTSAGPSGTTDEAGELVLSGVIGDGVQVVVGADERTWPVTVDALALTQAGGAQLAFQLSGRPPEGATYQGTAWCTACHSDVAADHAGTLHADALSTEVEGDLLDRFEAGETVDLGGATATLGLDAGSPALTVVDSSGASTTLLVAGLIGSATSRAVPYTDDGDQAWPLPVAWIADDPTRNTAFPDAAARLVAFETARWLDDAGRFVDLDPATSAEASCLPCHSVGFSLAPRDDGGVDMSAIIGAGRFSDAGVQCEACHGPGSAHATATDAADRPFTITSPELLPADRANQVCGQCHSRTTGTGTGLPYPLSDSGYFQPGQDLAAFATTAAVHWPDGTAAAPNMAGDELGLSPHGDGGPLSMLCLDCHTAHGVDDDGNSWPHQAVTDPDDNSLCLSCHLELSFGGDAGAPAEHVAHARYEPASDHQSGRCATCHMPETAATVAFSERSGAGDASSHLFLVVPPQQTVDWFDAEAATTLPVGSFPIHSCAGCHDYAEWYWDELWSALFPGVAGDPTLRQTHVDHQSAYAEKYE